LNPLFPKNSLSLGLKGLNCLFLTLGSAYGAFYASVFEPAAGVSGLAYALRHIGIYGALTGRFR